MAMVCIKGGECTGCMNCQEEEIIYCEKCEEDIQEGDIYYVLRGDTYCKYCVEDGKRSL